MKGRCLWKSFSIAAVAFGCGILLTFFLPESVLAVIEAFLILGVGVLYFIAKK